jgi:predicted HicB family RNase H-like nuclease
MPVQYTIRGVPREVDRELRRRARQRKVSLNQLLLDELQGAAGVRKKIPVA